VLQCVAVCCSVLQQLAVCCSVCCNVYLGVGDVWRQILIYVVGCCSVLQCVAGISGVLQCVLQRVFGRGRHVWSHID